MFCLWLQLVLNLPNFSFFISFANDCLKNFNLKVLGFLSLKLSTIDHFTTVKGNICWYFGPRSSLDQVKFQFSA